MYLPTKHSFVFGTLLLLGSALGANTIGVAKEDVNVRSKPTLQSEKMGAFIKGKPVEIIRKLRNKEGTWYETTMGYVLSPYISTNVHNPDQLRYGKAKEFALYESPSKDAKVIGSVDLQYLKTASSLEVRYKSGYDYPWYRLEKGWVNIPYLIKAKKQAVKQQPTVIEQADEQKAVSNAKAVAVKAVKKEDAPQKTATPQMQQTKAPACEIHYFIGAGVASNTLHISKKDQAGLVTLSHEPDSHALSYSVQGGAKINTNYIAALSYEHIGLDDVTIRSLDLSLDYMFDLFLHPSIGVSLGMGELEWSKDPLASSQLKDTKLSSFFYGLQAGIEYELDKHWSIYSNLQYKKFDFKTDLISISSKAQINHEDSKSIGIGVRYWF